MYCGINKNGHILLNLRQLEDETPHKWHVAKRFQKNLKGTSDK